MSTPAEPQMRTFTGEPEADGTNVREWFERRSFHHSEFDDIAHLADQKNRAGVSVTLVLPTRNVADTIGTVLSKLTVLETADLVQIKIIRRISRPKRNVLRRLRHAARRENQVINPREEEPRLEHFDDRARRGVDTRSQASQPVAGTLLKYAH